MEHYVNIMLDRGFKAVFGKKEVAIDFINAVLQGERVVKDLTYLDKEILPESKDQRTVIFDLLCQDIDGAKFILEMQNCPQRYFFNRGFYYLCRIVSRQGEIGSGWKYELLPVYGIYLLNFSLPEFRSWRTNIVLANEDTGETFGEIKLKQVYISFELFNLQKEECVTPLENMVYILKNMNIFDMSPFREENESFRRILDAANLNAMTPKERDVYDEVLKRYRDWRCTTEYAIEKAEEKGLKKGKAEEQRLIAANLKKQGVHIETIAQCTGLSIEEINEL
ncbi:Rpn family recombination-promoting nuclease/putative transposase [Parabacteroides sp.]